MTLPGELLYREGVRFMRRMLIALLSLCVFLLTPGCHLPVGDYWQSDGTLPDEKEIIDIFKEIMARIGRNDEEVLHAVKQDTGDELNIVSYCIAQAWRGPARDAAEALFRKEHNYTATEKQIDYLLSLGATPERLRGIDKASASALIDQMKGG